jgi:hypothetical protein
LGALEILRQAANGDQYGVAAVHYYWLGARRGGGAGREGRQPARRPQADRGLFALYGLILLLLGLFGSHHVKHKAAGINVDLWTGIGMRIFAALMIFWALSKPVAPEPEETRGQGSGRIRRAPAT